MGRAEDPSAAADAQGRVRGTAGLRVVDASVFPRIPGFFIATPIYMIAEKASAQILADAGLSRPSVFCAIRSGLEVFGATMSTPDVALQLIVPAMFIFMSIRFLSRALAATVAFIKGPAASEEAPKARLVNGSSGVNALFVTTPTSTGGAPGEAPAPTGSDTVYSLADEVGEQLDRFADAMARVRKCASMGASQKWKIRALQQPPMWSSSFYYRMIIFVKHHE